MSDELVRERYRGQVGADWTDALTGLANRAAIGLLLERRVAEAGRGGPRPAVALVDVDLLSAINHGKGLIEGDTVIRAVAEAIRSVLRTGDVAGRYGGGTFAVVLNGVDRATAVGVAERLRSHVNAELAGRATVTVGVASGCETGEMEMLAQAGISLRRAKMRGTRLAAEETLPPAAEERGLVAVVDDDPVNRKLMSLLLQPTGCEVIECGGGLELLNLARRADLDLVLLDVMMPDLDGFEVCRRLKTREETRQIPVILVTALNDAPSRVRGIEAGADDFLSKPPDRQELEARVRSLIRVRRLNRDYATIESVLFSLANAVEAKDRYTRGHTDRVRSLAVRLGTRLGLSRQDLTSLDLGGALHDVGKIGVSSEVLNKPGPLTAAEWAEMKTHTELGYRICLPLMRALGPALDIVRCHHEKLDGSSYPDGLKQDRLSKLVRIMTIVDMYDALVTDRPYRTAMDNEEAFRVLREGAAEGKLDTTLVEAMVQMLTEVPPARSGDTPASQVLVPTVLVVEGDPQDAKLVRTLLRMEGMRVIDCVRAEEGLRLAANHRPDAMLVDEGAAESLARTIRSDPVLSHTTLVALATPRGADTPRVAHAPLYDGYIDKPIDARTFVARLRACLEESQGVAGG